MRLLRGARIKQYCSIVFVASVENRQFDIDLQYYINTVLKQFYDFKLADSQNEIGGPEE